MSDIQLTQEEEAIIRALRGQRQDEMTEEDLKGVLQGVADQIQAALADPPVQLEDIKPGMAGSTRTAAVQQIRRLLRR